jgi:hypothetical protein
VIKLLLGLLLLFLGYREWQGRPQEGETPELPKWMQAIDTFTPVKALGIAAFLSGPNPKNLAFTIAAGISIAQLGLSTGEEFGALIVFIVIASLSVAVPVVWYLVARQQATRILASWRVWLTHNNALVMAVLLLVLGVSLVGKGISGLSA